MNRVNPRSLSQTVTHQLMDEIKSGKYSTVDRLPPEDELARAFGVSRSMMRECLTEVERTGIISRQKGVGTLINRKIADLPFRLDLITGLDSILISLGYETTSPFLSISDGAADEEIASNLEIPVGSPIFIAKRLVATDGKPSMFLTDYIPKYLLPGSSFNPSDLVPSIFNFLREYAGIETNMFLTEIRAVPVPKEAAEHMQIKEGSPILLLSEIGYDPRNTPVLYTHEYLADQVIRQIIVRKKI